MLLLFWSSLSLGESAIAPAGMRLISRSEVYFSGMHRYCEPISIGVPQIYGLYIKPKDINIKVSPGSPSYTPCQLGNLGNGTDKVNINFSSGKTELNLKLIVDENKDGIHQHSELKKVPGVLTLGEGSVYHFFVEVSPPEKAVKDSWSWAALTATSSGSDGPAYIGDNGLNYGGNDKVTAMISAQVE